MPLSSHIYDRDYFLSDRCEGFDRFREGHGLSPLKAAQVRALAPRPGIRVLDAGCGRGEVLLACARAGAQVAGIDYADAALEIAREVLADVPDADLRTGEVTALPWADESFDRVLFADVIEHLEPAEGVAALAELRRVLRPGGSLLVHTAPNRLFLRLTWPLARRALRATGRAEAALRLEEWIEASHAYHLNEQSLYSLRRGLRAAGFEDPRVWIHPDVLRSGEHHLTRDLAGGAALRLVERLARARPLRVVLGNDIYALTVKHG
jgi:ubiquinone/menaquinone biosynthesis C-methylase UbiE